MRSQRVDEFFTGLNSKVYTEYNRTTEKNRKVGYLFAIPVSFSEAILKLVRIIAEVVEALVIAIFNIIGSTCARRAQWAKDSTIKDALYYFEKIFKRIVYLPVAVLFTPIFLIYQTAILYKYLGKANPVQDKSTVDQDPLSPLHYSFPV